MSIIDNLLILLDDKKSRSIDEINNIFPDVTKQVIAASLGRLVSKKYISKTNSKFSITKSGQLAITNNLSSLDKLDNHFSDKVQFIIFNIPEKERINRDIFRNYLIKNGYGRLHNTVWIKNNKDNNINKIINQLGIKNNVLMFKVSINKNDLLKIFLNTKYNFSQINLDYKNFIKYSKDYLSGKKNRVKARCLVYCYSKILKMDPFMPKEYNKNNYLGIEGLKYYKKIRTHCY